MTEVRAAPVDWSRVNWATVDVRQLDYANMPPEARAAIASRIGEIRAAPGERRSRSGTPLPAAAGRDAGEHNRVFQIAANIIAGRRVLNEDGVAGRYTRAAIRDLQRDLLQQRRGDGVGGATTYDAVARALVSPPQRPPRIARVEPDRPNARNRADASPLTRAEAARPTEPRVTEPGPADRLIAGLGETDRGRRNEALRSGLRDIGTLPERDRPAAIGRVADSILNTANPADRIARARALLHDPSGAVTPEGTQARNAILAALRTERPGGAAPMSPEDRWRVANDIPLADRVTQPVSRDSLAALGDDVRAPVEITGRELAGRLADRGRANAAVQELGDLATEGGRESPRYGPTLDAIAAELRGRPDALPDTLANIGASSPQLLGDIAGRLHPGDEGARDAAVVAAHARAATRVPDAERAELARSAAERLAELHEDRPAFERALPQLRERFANDPSALGALLRYGDLPADMASDLVGGTWAHLPRPAQQAAAQWLIGSAPGSVPESMRAMVRQRADFSSGRVENADGVFALIGGGGLGVGALRASMARLVAARAVPAAAGAMGRYTMTGAGRTEMPRILQVGGERLTALERAQYQEIRRGIGQLMETNRALALQFREQLNTWMRVNNRRF